MAKMALWNKWLLLTIFYKADFWHFHTRNRPREMLGDCWTGRGSVRPWSCRADRVTNSGTAGALMSSGRSTSLLGGDQFRQSRSGLSGYHLRTDHKIAHDKYIRKSSSRKRNTKHKPIFKAKHTHTHTNTLISSVMHQLVKNTRKT